MCLIAIFYSIWKMSARSYAYLADGHRPIRSEETRNRNGTYTLNVYSWEEYFDGVADRIKGQLRGATLVKEKNGEMIWRTETATIFLAQARQYSPNDKPKPSPNDKYWVDPEHRRRNSAIDS